MMKSSSSSSSDSEGEWVDSQDYGSASYWESYYFHNAAQTGTETEWYAPLAAFRALVPEPAALGRSSARCSTAAGGGDSRSAKGQQLQTLVLGCGNSQLSMHLRDAGYGHITSVDISEVCVSQARAKYGADGSQQLSFEVADVRDMRALFSDASFDLVVDKATLDAVFIATGTDAGASSYQQEFDSVDRLLFEVRRVLAPGGVFISLSHMDRADFFFGTKTQPPPTILTELELESQPSSSSQGCVVAFHCMSMR